MLHGINTINVLVNDNIYIYPGGINLSILTTNSIRPHNIIITSPIVIYTCNTYVVL